MSSLVVGFAARMCKRATSSQVETPPDFEVLGGKRPKWSGPNGEARNNPVVMVVDSPERASDALSALEGAAQEAPKEPCVSLEDGVPDGPMLIK